MPVISSRRNWRDETSPQTNPWENWAFLLAVIYIWTCTRFTFYIASTQICITKFNAKAGAYDIFISKAALVSNQRLDLTMGHELLHVAYPIFGLNLSGNVENVSIYKWQYDQAGSFYMPGSARQEWINFKQYHDPSNDQVWQKLMPVRSINCLSW